MRVRYLVCSFVWIVTAGAAFSGCHSDNGPSAAASSNNGPNVEPIPAARGSIPSSTSYPSAKGSAGKGDTPIVETTPDGSVPEISGFGVPDARGAYQEVHVQPFHVTLDYFQPWDQSELKFDAEDQARYDIWSDDYKGVKTWGRVVEFDFQDGVLKSPNPASKSYPHLDASRTYATLKATLSYDNPAQAKEGSYLVSGIVTLVSGDANYGSVNLATGERDSGFRQAVSLGYQNSGAYYHDCHPNCAMGGQFNSFGNGKSDTGRVFEVGLVSTSSTPLSVSEFRQAMGSWAKLGYPGE